MAQDSESMEENRLPEKSGIGSNRLTKQAAKQVRSYTKFTPQRRKRFLRTLERTGNINSAAAHAGVSRATIYSLMRRNENFKEKVEMAQDKATGVLEEEAQRRAVEGVKKGIYFQGEHIADEQQYSDTLLIKLLEAAAPEKYGKKSSMHIQQDVNVNVEDSAKAKLASMLGLTDYVVDADFEEVGDESDG